MWEKHLSAQTGCGREWCWIRSRSHFSTGIDIHVAFQYFGISISPFIVSSLTRARSKPFVLAVPVSSDELHVAWILVSLTRKTPKVYDTVFFSFLSFFLFFFCFIKPIQLAGMEELPDFLNLRGYAASVLSRIRDLKEWPINCLIKGRETTFSEFELRKLSSF